MREFQRRTGWTPQRIADDLERELRAGRCRYLGCRYSSLADVTIDVINPKKPPLFHVNTTYCCMKCNASKGSMTPEAWQIKILEKYSQLEFLFR